MAMPDGIEALRTLAAAPRERLTRTAYNVRAFNPSAEEMRAIVLERVSRAPRIGFQVDEKRQGIVDSWPADVNDARRPPRLGVRAPVRPRDGLHRLPDPHHPRPLPPRA